MLVAGLFMINRPAQALPGSDTTRIHYRAEYGAAVQFGTTGFGAQLAWQPPIHSRLLVRIGISNLVYHKDLRFATGGEGTLVIQPDVKQNFALGSLKWHPFRRGSFFITAGGGYARHSALNLTIRAEDKIMFGGLELTPENVGTINAQFNWNQTVGYAGMGFGRCISHNRFGASIEWGCYYLGVPAINFQYSGFLETTTIKDQIPIIKRNLSGYRYLPSLQFTITYAIRR